VPLPVLEFWKELRAGRALRPDDKPSAASGVIGGVPMGLPPDLREEIEETA